MSIYNQQKVLFQPRLPSHVDEYSYAAQLPVTPEKIYSPRRTYAAAWLGQQATRHAEHALVIVAADNPTDPNVYRSEWSVGIMPSSALAEFKHEDDIYEKSELLMSYLQPSIHSHAGEAFELLQAILPASDFRPVTSSKARPRSTKISRIRQLTLSYITDQYR